MKFVSRRVGLETQPSKIIWAESFERRIDYREIQNSAFPRTKYLKMDYKKLSILIVLVAFVSGTLGGIVNLTKYSFDKHVTRGRPHLVIFYHQLRVNDKFKIICRSSFSFGKYFFNVSYAL